MRIGIDFLYAQQGTTQGYDSCLRNLLLGLDSLSREHEIIVFCNTPYYCENKDTFSNLQLVHCPGKWQNRFQRIVWASVFLPGLIKSLGIDGMYFPTHFRPITSLGRVWTVFNLYDLQYRYLPSSFGRLQLLVRDFFYRLSLKKCDRSICISEYVRNTVREQFPSIQAERLSVIPVPVVFEEVQPLPQAPQFVPEVGRYLLTIGKHFPHKNFETLLRAFAILLKTGTYSGELIIGGGFTSQTPFLRKLAEDLNITDRVRFLGYVSNEARESLYRSAELFVFPSLYEGFGMPVVEAMGRRIAVVCSDTTAIPEVTLGMANYYSLATDPNALAQAITNVLKQPPSQGRLQEISDQVQCLYNPLTIGRQYLALWESLGR